VDPLNKKKKAQARVCCYWNYLSFTSKSSLL